MKKKKKKVVCAGCGEVFKENDPVYEVRSGYINKDGEFVREDLVGQLFHTGKCLNSEE